MGLCECPNDTRVPPSFIVLSTANSGWREKDVFDWERSIPTLTEHFYSVFSGVYNIYA